MIFWEKKSKDTKINGLKTDSGETLTNTNEIANYINRHFAAIGPNLASKISTDEDNVSPEQFLTKKDPSFHFKGVDSPRVLKLLNGIKTAQATGIDKISNRTLKNSCSHYILKFNRYNEIIPCFKCFPLFIRTSPDLGLFILPLPPYLT